jgi:hypothetical protein
MMKTLALSLTLAAVLALPASAECYADYKAKQDNPLRLSYGVIQLSDASCADKAAAKREIAGRIAAGGWQLLNLMSVFGPEGLAQRKDSAGEFFLRY